MLLAARGGGGRVKERGKGAGSRSLPEAAVLSSPRLLVKLMLES